MQCPAWATNGQKRVIHCPRSRFGNCRRYLRASRAIMSCSIRKKFLIRREIFSLTAGNFIVALFVAEASRPRIKCFALDIAGCPAAWRPSHKLVTPAKGLVDKIKNATTPVIARSETTWRSLCCPGHHRRVRLPRYARNDEMGFFQQAPRQGASMN